MLKHIVFKSALIAVICSASIATHARADEHKQINVPAGDLIAALKTLAQQSGIDLVYRSDQLEGLHTQGIAGTLSPQEAVTKLLEGTPLTVRTDETGAIMIALPRIERPAKSTSALTDGAEEFGGGQGQRIDPDERVRVAQVDRESSAAGPSIGQSDTLTGKDSNRIELEEIVVTGSHIRGAGPVGSSLITIDRQQIEDSGYGRLQDVLAVLPQNFKGASEENNQLNGNVNYGADIQLRGLGPGTTLTLVNGLRQPGGGSSGAFVDISSIPTVAIERIEILADGASAIYGSEAIGGVANIILRDDFDGAESEVRYGTAQGEGDEMQLSQLFGLSGDAGNFLAGYQYLERDPVPAASREYSARNGDMSAYGGADFRALGRLYASSPGTILNPATGTAMFAIPAGQNGTSLTPAQLIPGAANYTDNVSLTDVLPQQKMHSVFLNGALQLSDTWSLFSSGRYSTRDATARLGPRVVTVVVPTTNPFYVNAYGNGTPVIVAYDLARDLGPVTSSAETETYSAAIGLDGALTNRWHLRLTGGYGREDALTETAFTDRASATTAAALNAALADTNRATALNAFGNGTANNPATLNALRNIDRNRGVSEIWSGGAIADGALFHLPGGSARIALGVDYRNETQRVATAVRDVTEDRNVTAAFAEASLPLIGRSSAMTGVQALDLSIAARYEDYSDFGSTLDPKVGLSYNPVQSLKIRGSWGTSFRAPPFFRSSLQIGGGNAVLRSVVPDPRSPNGVANVLTIVGNNPDLKEETATVWSAGLDFAPAEVEKLKVSLTYFDIHYKDRIEALRPALALEQQYAGLILRDPTAEQINELCTRPGIRLFGSCAGPIGAILDGRQRNVSVVEVNGLDLSVGHAIDSNHGTWSYGIGGTRMFGYERAVTESAPPVDFVDTVDNPLALRLRGHLSWRRRELSAGLIVNYTGAYQNPAIVPAQSVDSLTTFDLNASYEFERTGSWLDQLRIHASAVNVLNEEPPFVNEFIGYDGANSSILGRFVSLQLSKTW